MSVGFNDLSQLAFPETKLAKKAAYPTKNTR